MAGTRPDCRRVFSHPTPPVNAGADRPAGQPSRRFRYLDLKT
ncbi:MAG: hypothetical protein AVDCRST_MAG56-1363 [uncultured Cytophagales bacterium]|uniref:Uncharacterized protein n=1 Tax=uncultured Cytophagales bacterium TaxID=158755 RepID=A0A6J4HX79_9SPHI|nr:MAG: hypothetical protein AVDCRST_MAG56-1363 [uncultured Cytophagales bacterium]